MKGMKIKEKEGSAIGMYIRSSYILPNRNDMRSIVDIPKLCAMHLEVLNGTS